MQIAAKNIISKSREYWGLALTAEEAGSTIEMVAGSAAPAISLEFSVDNGQTWSPFEIGITTITLPNAGDAAYFRAGKNGTGGPGSNITMASGIGDT